MIILGGVAAGIPLIETLGRATRLRRAQRNILFRLIEESSSDARQFSWEEPPDETLVFREYGSGGVCFLRHEPTDSLFKILAYWSTNGCCTGFKLLRRGGEYDIYSRNRETKFALA